MSPRKPSPTLVVDANVILSAALGLRSRPVLEFVAQQRVLLISETGRSEVLHNAQTLAEQRGMPGAPLLANRMLALTLVVQHASYADRVASAADTLRLAVASRNGSVGDAHLLALAWTADADIWSHDRDFAGTGWPSWSSANLRAAL